MDCVRHVVHVVALEEERIHQLALRAARLLEQFAQVAAQVAGARKVCVVLCIRSLRMLTSQATNEGPRNRIDLELVAAIVTPFRHRSAKRVELTAGVLSRNKKNELGGSV